MESKNQTKFFCYWTNNKTNEIGVRNGSKYYQNHSTGGLYYIFLKKVGFKKSEPNEFPDLEREFKSGDELLVNCSEMRINRFIDKHNVAATKLKEIDGEFVKQNVLSDEVGICELIVAPKSSYKGRHINTGRFGEKYNVQVMALNRHNKRIRGREFDLQEGDSILVRAKWEDIKAIQEESRDFLIIGSPEELSKEVGKDNKKRCYFNFGNGVYGVNVYLGTFFFFHNGNADGIYYDRRRLYQYEPIVPCD